ncbi:MULTISPECIES: phosphoribosyltransferase [Acidiplasma]|uniref:Phosphoribosyltransferase n=3 Tax=Acidiplasma TaxID=507753 RepID=A0A0Q1B1J2_9ARCH|nr:MULTISPECIES: phosphoribosyltransferase [Acidiplasma]KQB33640.1 phosphoribosyltransferase [Acidiplasma cupricumulans]KQB34420.1 phosphoribosyltransferase [Acidiplasma aeolicum]WMT54219.1 MAG: phosphoribosyltransferase [Acidiplasma sp.]
MEFKAVYVTWQDIEDWCSGILDMVLEDRYNPDVIVGIARGGLVPARMISDYLIKKELISIKTEHWGLTANMDGKAVLAGKTNYDMSGKKVLLVDDITDTGESMKVALDYIKSLNPSVVKSASMLYVNEASFRPDYFGIGIKKNDWAWFIFPWNVYEDTYNLLKKFLSEPLDLDAAEKILRDNYGLDTSRVNLSNILKNLSRSGMIKENKDKFYI